MSNLITASFPDAESASQAVEELVETGVDKERISLLMSEETQKRYFAAPEKGEGVRAVDVEKNDRAEEGVAGGAAIGGTLGAIGAALAVTGVGVAPGVGLAAAGPIVGTLAGAGAGGMAGGVVGLLVGMGVKEHIAKPFAEDIKKGSILVAAETDRDPDEVEKILKNHGGDTKK